MRIAIIGRGTIGNYVRRKCAEYGIVEIAQIVRQGKEAPGNGTEPSRVSDVADLPSQPDFIVDCGGHAALAGHGPKALARGIDLMTVSLGALADANLTMALDRAAQEGGARLHLCTGAIGGLDALRSAFAGRVDKVTYIGRKPPKGWNGSPAEDKLDLENLQSATTHFEGSAREAALSYPKNANVAAAVALSGIGFERTQVRLIADPSVTMNLHEIHASGEFGEMHFNIAGHGLPENPRSSALAAMSIISALREQQKRIGF